MLLCSYSKTTLQSKYDLKNIKYAFVANRQAEELLLVKSSVV